jgi:hypothetical protein
VQALTGNNSPAKSPHAHHLSPITPVNSDRCPAFLAASVWGAQLLHARTRMVRKPILASCDLGRIQFWVAEVCPHR